MGREKYKPKKGPASRYKSKGVRGGTAEGSRYRAKVLHEAAKSGKVPTRNREVKIGKNPGPGKEFAKQAAKEAGKVAAEAAIGKGIGKVVSGGRTAYRAYKAEKVAAKVERVAAKKLARKPYSKPKIKETWTKSSQPQAKKYYSKEATELRVENNARLRDLNYSARRRALGRERDARHAAHNLNNPKNPNVTMSKEEFAKANRKSYAKPEIVKTVKRKGSK